MLDVELTPEAARDPVFAGMPARFVALQWHGDTYELPAGAALLARSEHLVDQVADHEAEMTRLARTLFAHWLEHVLGLPAPAAGISWPLAAPLISSRGCAGSRKHFAAAADGKRMGLGH